MITIRGDYIEGGGQILRTAVGLSAYTGKHFRINNIRKGRCNPGLSEQHMQAVNAVAKLCNGKVVGNKLRSNELEFTPGKIKSGKFDVKINTAGSVGLVLQALLIPALKTNVIFDIIGGSTFGKWAAPVDFIDKILGYYLRKMGFEFNINIKKEGFFPKGGADVLVSVSKSKLKRLIINEHGKNVTVAGVSKASESLNNAEVAERQSRASEKILADYFNTNVKIKNSYSSTTCPGSGIQVWVESDNSIVGGNSFGEKGKPAEIVGQEAAKKLIEQYEKGVVPSNAADQLIPYMGMAHGSKIKTSKITNHIKTNIKTVEKFLDVKFKIKGTIISS